MVASAERNCGAGMSLPNFLPPRSKGAGHCILPINESLDVGCTEADVSSWAKQLPSVKGNSWSCEPLAANVTDNWGNEDRVPEGI